MVKKFITTFWNYNSIDTFKLEMVADWAGCGMNAPVSPIFRFCAEHNAKIHAMLDEAQRLGIGILLQAEDLYVFGGIGSDPEKYRKTVKTVHSEFGSHPAMLGYYVGEEPKDYDIEGYYAGVRILKEEAPEAMIYINCGSIERTERCLLCGKQTLTEWGKEYVSRTGSNIIGFGCYSQLMNDNTGIPDLYSNLSSFGKMGREAGADIWATLLSSAHDFYRVPTEDDFRWQLNISAVTGCKAAVWFRLYDKLAAGDYRGSPIDEFGEKTMRYYDLARVQKRFNIHYGELFGRFKYLGTYGVGSAFVSGFSYFYDPSPDCYISTAYTRRGLISFFKDTDGTDYFAIMNTDIHEAAHYHFGFTSNVKKVEQVYFGGEQLNCVYREGDYLSEEGGNTIMVCLAPGQLELYKVTF